MEIQTGEIFPEYITSRIEHKKEKITLPLRLLMKVTRFKDIPVRHHTTPMCVVMGQLQSPFTIYWQNLTWWPAWLRQSLNYWAPPQSWRRFFLTHFPQGRIYASVSRVSIGSDNGLAPIWRQVIIWISAVLFSIWPLGTNFSEILMKGYFPMP